MMDKNCMMMDEQMSNERKEKLEFTAEHHKEALKMLSWDKAVLEQQEKYGEGYRFVSVDKDNNKTYTYDIFTAGRYEGILFSINKDGSLDFCSIPKKMLSEDPINPDWYDCPGGELINVLKLVLTPEEWRGYCKGNIFKYVIRAPNKNKAEDFNKGIKYIEFLRDGGLNE